MEEIIISNSTVIRRSSGGGGDGGGGGGGGGGDGFSPIMLAVMLIVGLPLINAALAGAPAPPNQVIINNNVR